MHLARTEKLNRLRIIGTVWEWCKIFNELIVNVLEISYL